MNQSNARRLSLALIAVVALLCASGCRSQGKSFHYGGPFRALGMTMEHMGEHRSSSQRLAETAHLFNRGERVSRLADTFHLGSMGQAGAGVAMHDLFFGFIEPYGWYELEETFSHMRR